MEKYFDNLDDLANWAASNDIDVISIDAHKCMSMNGGIRYGLSCIAKKTSTQRSIHGRFNSNKFSDPHLIDAEAEKLESQLRRIGFDVDRPDPLPV